MVSGFQHCNLRYGVTTYYLPTTDYMPSWCPSMRSGHLKRGGSGAWTGSQKNNACTRPLMQVDKYIYSRKKQQSTGHESCIAAYRQGKFQRAKIEEKTYARYMNPSALTYATSTLADSCRIKSNFPCFPLTKGKSKQRGGG